MMRNQRECAKKRVMRQTARPTAKSAAPTEYLRRSTRRVAEHCTHQKRVLLELMFEAANLMKRGNESSSMSFQMAS